MDGSNTLKPVTSSLDDVRAAFQFSWKAWLLAFAASVLVLSFKYRDVYFVRPVYEQDDFAINALSIRNAGEFKETLGNYSRWHFRHPGPVMFYMYAWGGAIFHTGLGICPAEHNAHVFTSMLFQSAFWAAVFGMLASYSFSLRSLCLVWIAGWIHFALTQHAFVSIWPPHVLLMPFVCYAVACASVAAGRVSHLWLLIPSGIVLVHAHVAQPLTVGLMGIGAVVGAVGVRRNEGRWDWPRGSGLRIWLAVTALTTALLLLPMVVELLRWPHSNLNAILDYAGRNRHDTKTIAQLVDYLLQFSRYWGFHDEPSGKLFGVIQTHAYYFIAWCLVLYFSVKLLLERRKLVDLRSQKFLVGLASMLFISLLAAVIWGTRMAGPMFAFNGFYYYGIYFIALCVVALGWSELRFKPLSVLNLLVVGVAVVAPFTFKSAPLLSDRPPGSEVKAGIESMVKSGRIDLSKPYLLTFFPHLASAVTVMNTLDRMGGKVFVPVAGEWVMGRQFTVGPETTYSAHPEILQISPPAPGRSSEIPLYDQGRLTVESTRHDPHSFPLRVDFNGTPGVGVSGMVSNGVEPPWSSDRLADIVLLTKPTSADVRVTFSWLGLLGPKNSHPRRVIVRVPGMEEIQFSVTELRDDTFTIPAGIWNKKVESDGFIHLQLMFLDPISPKECGLNEDPRPLSISFRGLVFETVKSAP